MIPIRAERKARGWSVRAMAERLRDAADRPNDVTSVSSLVHNIYRWEIGKTGITERYRHLYCRVFGRSEFDLFGIGSPEIISEPPEIIPDVQDRPPPPGIPAGTVMPEGTGGGGYVLVVFPPGQHRITIDITVTGEGKELDSAPEPEQARTLTVVKDEHPGQLGANRPPGTRVAGTVCTGCGFPLSRYNPGNLCQACVRAESRTQPAGPPSGPAAPG